MRRIITTKRVARNGNSLALHLTWELRELGLGVGDTVQVTLEADSGTDSATERIEGDDNK